MEANLNDIDKKEMGIESAPPSTLEEDIQFPAEDTIVISKTEKPHSYECGKAGARHKIYYNEVSELNDHLEKLKNSKLLDEVE